MKNTNVIVLVSCGKNKRDYNCRAEEMYVSSRFLLAKKYAKLRGDSWYIVSAKHGILKPCEQIEPYDVWLDQYSEIEKQHWCSNVRESIKELPVDTKFVVLLGGSYAVLINKILAEEGYSFWWPLKDIEEKDYEYIISKSVLESFAV